MRQLILFLLLCTTLVLHAQEPRLIIPTGHDGNVKTIHFLSSGQFFLSGDNKGVVKLWEAATGREFYTYGGHQEKEEILSIASSSDNRWVVTGGSDGAMVAHQTFSGVQRWKISVGVPARALAIVDSTVLSAQGNLLIGYRLSDGAELWRKETGGAPITALSARPGSAFVFLGKASGDCIRFNLNTQELTEPLKRLTKEVLWIQYSGDGTAVFAASKGNRLIRMRADNGAVADDWDIGAERPLQSIAMSPDGLWFATAYQAGPGLDVNEIPARLWRMQGRSLQPERALNIGMTDYALAFTPNSQYLLSGRINTGEIAMQQVSNGEKVREFTKHAEIVSHLEANNSALLTASQDLFGTARVYALDRMMVHLLKDKEAFGGKMISSLTNNGEAAIVARLDGGAIEQWDVITGQLLSTRPYDGFSLRALTGLPEEGAFFLSDGRSVERWGASGEAPQGFDSTVDGISQIHYNSKAKLLAAVGENKVAVWDAVTGELLNDKIATGGLRKKNAAAFSEDGSLLVASNGKKVVEIWDMASQQKLDARLHDHSIHSVAFSPDQAYLLLGDETGDIHVWRTEGSREPLLLRGHTKKTLSLAFSTDGRRLYSSSEDRTVRIWDWEAKEELGRVINWDDEEWVVTTPEGLYDASPKAMQRMYYVSPAPGNDSLEVIALDQLSESFYEPGLLPKLVMPEAPPIRVVTDLKLVKLFPMVKGRIEGDELLLELEERAGGIGRVSLFLNQKELEADVSNKLKKRDGLHILRYDLKPYEAYLWANPDSTNRISVEVTGADRELSSSRLSWVYEKHRTQGRGFGGNDDGTAAEEEDEFYLPRLFIISVGTSDYTGVDGTDEAGRRDPLDLSFPDQDATYIAAALYNTGRHLFEDRVTVHCLTTQKLAPIDTMDINWAFPQKKAVKAAFESVEEAAKPEDIVIAYFSGHGLAGAFGGEDIEFFYLTHDIGSESRVEKRGPRESYTISSAELTNWLNAIKAQKQALIVDACNSGAIVDNMSSGSKTLNTTQIRAYERMKDRAGLFLLSGSTADKKSYESSAFGNGLLTYALLSGMRGEGEVFERDGNSAKLINLVSLFTFARDRVPVLAKSIREIQTPTLTFPGSASGIYIGQFKRASDVPIGKAKPTVLRPLFQSSDSYGDPLQLNLEVEQFLFRESERGLRAKWAFKDMFYDDGGYTLAGRYQQKDGQWVLQAKVFQNGEAVHTFDLPPHEDAAGIGSALKRALYKWMDEQGF
ncbi:MAG: caspase family protein [Phaeodactylibacter sp.]|uniref:caspase family protein n=1 Tax=Phaeodactylibacter sp. TaxID=1940289 RepID=UPI0032EE786A